MAGIRIAIALVCLGLTCCTSTGIHKVLSRGLTTGVAVSTSTLLSTIHPPYVGMRVRVLIRGAWFQAIVTRLGPYGLVEIQGFEKNLDLQPSDFGSPIMLIIGTVKRPRQIKATRKANSD